jgi:hypothetical protein
MTNHASGKSAELTWPLTRARVKLQLSMNADPSETLGIIFNEHHVR